MARHAVDTKMKEVVEKQVGKQHVRGTTLATPVLSSNHSSCYAHRT